MDCNADVKDFIVKMTKVLEIYDKHKEFRDLLHQAGVTDKNMRYIEELLYRCLKSTKVKHERDHPIFLHLMEISKKVVDLLVKLDSAEQWRSIKKSP